MLIVVVKGNVLKMEASSNLSDITCVLIGDCYIKEYKYTFLYENKEYEADKCIDLRYGSNICYYEDKKFYNVSYTSEFVCENHIYQKGLLHFIWPVLVLLIISIIFRLWLVVSKE